MRIEEFKYDTSLINDFIKFGYEIYKGDSNWIPPHQDEIKRQLLPSYWFYNKPGNLFRKFLLYDNGSVQGRIMAMINPSLKDKDGTAVGTIGFFECQNNYQYARAILEIATKWLYDNNIKRIWGPMNFDIWHSYRFMTRGFNHDLFFGEPYNKPYYPEYFEKFGFKIKAEWDSVEIHGKDILAEMKIKGEKRYNLLMKRGYRFELIDLNNLDNELIKLQQIMSKSFGGFLGFTPLRVEELKQLFEKANYAIHPRMFTFVYNADNILCGFAIALLELADAVRSMNGRTNIPARLRFMYHRHKVRKINFYLGGLTPEEIKNRSGLGRAGFYFIINEILKGGYNTMLLTLRLKSNLAHSLPGCLSPEPQKEYALYQVEL
ncbi:MAG: hypothetical protein GY865_19860 [candidate division Zixibacteria bacterium]|nr:hypothetical protein [candidate division Zixibacteria bacterium]